MNTTTTPPTTTTKSLSLFKVCCKKELDLLDSILASSCPCEITFSYTHDKPTKTAILVLTTSSSSFTHATFEQFMDELRKHFTTITDITPTEDNHNHGPTCGHIAIVHSAAPSPSPPPPSLNTTSNHNVHIGYVESNGMLSCFIPKSSDLTFEACLASNAFVKMPHACDPSHIGGGGGRRPDEHDNKHPLLPKTSKDNSSSPTSDMLLLQSPFSFLADLVTNHDHHAYDHQHGEHCGHPRLDGGDHYDYLVEDEQSGRLLLHHQNSFGTCESHGSFLKHTAPLPPPQEQSSMEGLAVSWSRLFASDNIVEQYLPFLFPGTTDAVTEKNEHTQQSPSAPPNDDQQHPHDDGDNEHHHHQHKVADKPVAAAPLLLPPPSSILVTSILTVEGICCSAECPIVEEIALSIPGVREARINVIAKQVYISHERKPATPNTKKNIDLETQQEMPNENDDHHHHDNIAHRVSTALTRENFPSRVIRDGDAPLTVPPTTSNHKQKTSQPTTLTRWPSMIVIFAFLLWLASFFSHLNPPQTNPIQYLAIAAVALALPRIAYKGLMSLKRIHVLDINVLMTIAVIGALGTQQYEEAAAVVVVFSMSDWLESRATSRARIALQALIDLKPDTAIRYGTGEVIHVETVRVGDTLLLRPGDRVPVDCVLIDDGNNGGGGVAIDESNLTGESVPVDKIIGSELSAGTVNVGSSICTISCTRLSEDSAVARLVNLVNISQLQRSPTEQMVERIAAIYTPCVCFGALLMATIPWAFGTEIGKKWLESALTLLVVSCPCALVISTPITYVSAMAEAGRHGILIKGGKFLESLATAKTLACDKTGTLTTGEFHVDEVKFVGGGEETTTMYLQVLYMMEENAVHPMAKAIRTYAKDMLGGGGGADSAGLRMNTCHLIPGHGLCATFEDAGEYVISNSLNNVIMTGNSNNNHTTIQEMRAWGMKHGSQGSTVSWLSHQGRLICGIAASDHIREETRGALAALVQYGIHITVLTGDNMACANNVQTKLGFGDDDVKFVAELKPEDKVREIKRLKALHNKTSPVLFVGDGVNDAPALATCDVGIAMGATGAPVAIDTADVALMDNNLNKLVRLIRLSRSARNKIMFNIILSITLKIVMVSLAVAGYVNLDIAIGADVGSMLLVTLNSVSLLTGRVVLRNGGK